MKRRYSWEEMIPVNETYMAAEFLVKTWKQISNSYPEQTRFARHEPKLTELLCYHLRRLKARSGLTGFWVNEEQEPHLDGEGKMGRIKKDITYYSNVSNLPLELVFEFKKLSKSSLATYRGKQGMRRFVDGNYAPQKPLAIMVGIIIKSKSKEVINALYNSLSRTKVNMELQMVSDATGRYIRKPSEAIRSVGEFDTEHRRPADQAPPNGTTTITHIFIMCIQ